MAHSRVTEIDVGDRIGSGESLFRRFIHLFLISTPSGTIPLVSKA